MMETPTPRRPQRAARPRYRAVVQLTYPATEELARRRLEHAERDHEWAKSNPGDPVPDWVVAMSPGLVSKGRVELASDDVPADNGVMLVGGSHPETFIPGEV